jgi:RNA polymerase sigma-70 factor (family 1)
MRDIEKTELYHISQGNEIAFSHFIDHYSSRLYYHVYGIVRQKEIAEEIVSDVFVIVWNKRKSLYKIKSMTSWLNTLAYHKSLDHLRKESHTHREMLLIDNDEFKFQFPIIQSPIDNIISQEECNKLQRAIDMLPPKCRHVFFLAKIEEMSYADIAHMLNISVATVNYHIVFALNALNKKLKRA